MYLCTNFKDWNSLVATSWLSIARLITHDGFDLVFVYSHNNPASARKQTATQQPPQMDICNELKQDGDNNWCLAWRLGGLAGFAFSRQRDNTSLRPVIFAQTPRKVRQISDIWMSFKHRSREPRQQMRLDLQIWYAKQCLPLTNPQVSRLSGIIGVQICSEVALCIPWLTQWPINVILD